MKHFLLWAAFAVALVGCALRGEIQTAGALRTDCASAVVVGLRWDGPRAARYRITRDGTTLGSTSETSFVDTTVAASMSYSYSVNGSAPLVVNTPAAAPSGEPPYCRSRHIDSITFDWAHGFTEPNGSDLWPVTWGKDGNVYTFFGDGGGFGGDNYRGRVSFGVAKMTAPPPPTAENVTGPTGAVNVAGLTGAINIYGGFQAEHPSTVDGKAGSIIAVGDDFYTIGGLYDARELRGRTGHKSGGPRRNQLAYSKGNAHSWQAAPWNFCSPESAPGTFCAGGFINYGRGNAGAPDDFVYLVGGANSADYWVDDSGPEVAAEQGRTAAAPAAVASESIANTYLARVSKRHVLQRDAYRYFAGLDDRGHPVWSNDQKWMQPVFTDRDPTQATTLGNVSYVPGIHRYIASAQGPFMGQTSFYDAPQPWGPWTVISYNNIDPRTGAGGWANLGKAAGGTLGIHIVNAWTSKDGLSLWMTYSSDGKAPEGALFPPAGTLLDSFNLVHAQLSLHSTAIP